MRPGLSRRDLLKLGAAAGTVLDLGGPAPVEAQTPKRGIQRHVAQQAWVLFGPSVSAVAAWEPHVKNFSPNIGHDYGGRLMAAWLDR